MRFIKHAAEQNDVEYALAEIGKTRVCYTNLSLQRCLELRPESSVFLKWCISLQERLARDQIKLTKEALMKQWKKPPEFDAVINVNSLHSV
jgi:hypothetical protein